MAELQRNFLQGIMNKDLDPHFLPDGQYRDALNIIVGDSDGQFIAIEGSNNGAAQNYLGNELQNTSLGLTNAQCIGSLSYDASNLIYWLVASDTADAIYEYNESLGLTTIVLKATKATPTTPSILNFNKTFYVTGINYINGLLFWTDNYNPPRRINIERAKNYGVDGFTEEDINVIVAPPIAAPTIALSNTGDSNNLENKFVYFSYRYKYIDNEYSALSPFSPVAFLPKYYEYDYGVSENISMTNINNTVTITYDKGGDNVTEIQLIYRDTLSLNTYVIDNIQRNLLASVGPYTYQFKNNKVYTIIDSNQLNRLFDNVPLKAKSQDLIGSRLVYGNYTQFFNLIDCDDFPINPQFSLSLTAQTITGLNPKPTFKSNRDYEIGIVYLDDYARSTTVIIPNGNNTNNTNTIYIPPQNASLANNIRVTISKDFKPPCFATYYRFVLKQNKQDYYNIFPLTYFADGQFKWFLINQSDADKISVGSYVYLKTLVSSTNIQYKILDIQSKSANFLNSSDSGQPAGVYFKVKIDSISLPPVTYFTDNNLGGYPSLATTLVDARFNVAERSIFYGTGLNNMNTGGSNVYTGVNDARFYVEIDSTGGASDTFKYYVSYNKNYKVLVASNIPINSATDQSLTYSGSICSIRFLSNTGHTTKDYWVVNCRGNLQNSCKNIFGGFIDYSTITPPGVFFTLEGWSPNLSYNSDRPIKAGGILTFKYKETNGTDQYITQTFISSRDYVNIEEWFIEDSAYQKWISFNDLDESIGPQNVCFRRGQLLSLGRPGSITQGTSISNSTLSYPVYMYFYSEQGGTNPAIDTKFTLQQSDFSVIFETAPTDTNQDIYYELSKTYPITNGIHIGNVQNQILPNLPSTPGQPAIVDLNTFSTNSDFNAFAWGNNVESYRIRDDFNAATMEFSPRANSTVEGYEQQTLVQALTYSGVYQQTTAINRLNEFNLSLGNFKYLDRFFGSIEKIYARDTDLVVLQENKISKVLYGKNLLSDSTGGGVVASIPEVLGTQIAYVGEYGISNNPESFAIWGNNLYFTDARRGAVLQLAENGLFEISSNGMKNWFKANLDPATQKLGMFDPYFEHYVLSNNLQNVQYCIFEVTEDVVSFGTAAINDQYAFTINSNNEWYIEVPANNWLTLNTLYGNDNTLIYFDALINTGSSRSVTVVVRGCGGTHNVVFTQAGVTTTPTPTTLPPTTLPPTTLPPTTLPPIYYKLDSCSLGYGQLYTSIFPGTSPTTLANQRYIDSVTLVYYVWDNTSTTSPGTIGTNLQKVSGQVGCPDPTTLPPTTTLPPPMNLEVRICGGVTTYFITVTNQGLTNGLALKLTKAGTPFDGIDCWEIIDNATTHAIDYSLVTVNSTSLSCASCATPTTPAPTTTTTCAASTYYELSECSPGVAIAYTLIAPTLGTGQRYVLPSPQTFYTYTGSSLTQCDVPPTYNSSIQATAFTGCPSATTLPPTTLAPLVVTNGSVTCNGSTGSWRSSFSGGTGVYSYVAYASSQANAANAIINPSLRVTLTPGDLFYDWSGIANGTWYVALMDSNGTTTVQNTPVIVNCTAPTTLPPTTTLAPEWYQLTSCTDGSIIYSTQYTVGAFGINNRVTIIGGAIFRITAVTSTNPGGTQQNITQTGLTGCPATTTLPPPTTTLAPMSFTYSTSCAGGAGTGIITINSISGGTGTGYQYSIQPTPGTWFNYPTTNQLTGLANGTYTVAVRDSAGNGTSIPGISISCITPTTLPPTTLAPTTTCAPNGTLLSTFCSGFDLIGVYANGNCGTYNQVIQFNSPSCGYVAPTTTTTCTPNGTLLSTYCSGFNLVGVYANGNCGTFDSVIEFNSPSCGFVPPTTTTTCTPAGTLLSTFCSGFDLIGTYANGSCGTYNQPIQFNSPSCGYVAPTTTIAPTTTTLPPSCNLFRFTDDVGNGGFVYYVPCGTTNETTVFVDPFTAPQYCVAPGTTPYSFDGIIIDGPLGSCT
jgi:hypothetical protein